MPLILIPLIVVLINDFSKVIIHFIRKKEFKLSLMFRSGGMPSGHTSFVSSALTIVFLELGPGSLEFMITAVFCVIVMYDARGIRRKTGYHAELLNKIQSERKFDESLGHTNLEVTLGFLFGVFITFFIWKTGYFLIS